MKNVKEASEQDHRDLDSRANTSTATNRYPAIWLQPLAKLNADMVISILRQLADVVRAEMKEGK